MAGAVGGADQQRQVEPVGLIGDSHLLDPGVVLDLGSLQEAEHRPDGVGVELHLAGEPGGLRQDLCGGEVDLVSCHDKLDHSATATV